MGKNNIEVLYVETFHTKQSDYCLGCINPSNDFDSETFLVSLGGF